MIEIRELKNSISQQRTKSAENLHKHSHTAILSTNAFKLQSSAQKTRLFLCWLTFLYQLKEKTFQKPFLISRSTLLFCRKFLHGPVCILVKMVTLRPCNGSHVWKQMDNNKLKMKLNVWRTQLKEKLRNLPVSYISNPTSKRKAEESSFYNRKQMKSQRNEYNEKNEISKTECKEI